MDKNDTMYHHDDVVVKSEKPSLDAGAEAIDAEAEKKLVRKIDPYILPCMWIKYLLSYMDRTNIGNALIAGMDEDLDLDSNRYSIALVVFFVSYVVFEVPSNMILTRVRPSRYLPGIMCLWGCVTIGMGFTPNYEALVAFRFVMGMLEAGFPPGLLMLLSIVIEKNKKWLRKGHHLISTHGRIQQATEIIAPLSQEHLVDSRNLSGEIVSDRRRLSPRRMP